MNNQDRLAIIKEKNKRLRKEYASRGIKEFGQTYFPEYFTLPSPEVHLEIYSELEDIVEQSKVTGRGNHLAYALPRGCAKSTILDFLFPLFLICFGMKKYILIISASQTLANSFLENIKDELEFNERLKEDFGELRGDLWNAETFATKNGVKVQSIGAGAKVRGLKNGSYRPDLVILDDVENDEGVRSSEQRKKLKDWYYKAVSKVGDKSTDFVFLGTVLHFDALLISVLQNPNYKSKIYSAVLTFSERPDLWTEWGEIFSDLSDDDRVEKARDFFEENKDEMLKGTSVLWKEKYDYYTLMVMKLTEGESAFNTEMQNIPLNPEDAVFNPEWFQYYTDEELDWKNLDLYTSLDVSMGSKNTSDFSAIITLARHRKNGQMYVVTADVKRRHPDQTIEDVATILGHYKTAYNKAPKILAVETVAFQAYFKDILRQKLMAKGVYVNIQGINNTQDKQMRIERLQPDIKNGYIKFHKSHKLLIQQLQEFPLGSHDDAPDALEMARRIVGRVLTTNGVKSVI